MARLTKYLIHTMIIVLALVLAVVGVRAVNGWRYSEDESAADPAAIESYDTEPQGIDVEHITGEYLNGFHLVPEDVTGDGVVVTFGGSEGSPAYDQALAVAEQGYEVYALFFFGQENQQPDLNRVPLEFFDEVVRRIEDTAERPGPLTVIGASKGAELALSLAEHHDAVDNLVLFAPSMYAFQGLSFTDDVGSSWSLDGEDVAHLSFEHAGFGAVIGQFGAMAFNYPLSYRSTYEALEENAPAAEKDAAQLDPSAVQGGLLVFAGAQDEMWQSDTAARRIQETHPDARVHIFEDAGHVFGGPGHMAGLATGGVEEANAAAGEDSAVVLADTLAAWHD